MKHYAHSFRICSVSFSVGKPTDGWFARNTSERRLSRTFLIFHSEYNLYVYYNILKLKHKYVVEDIEN